MLNSAHPLPSTVKQPGFGMRDWFPQAEITTNTAYRTPDLTGGYPPIQSDNEVVKVVYPTLHKDVLAGSYQPATNDKTSETYAKRPGIDCVISVEHYDGLSVIKSA